jgi:NAD dependent epimerase/dehydratase family enzyme
MKIVIPGGSGQVGTLLAHALHADGHDVVVLSRQLQVHSPWRTAAWDGATLGPWVKEVDEPGAPRAWNFSIEVAQAWERALEESVTPKTRKVALRSAMTMSPDAGGIFDTLLALVRRGLGGTAGNGRQFVSWIHFEDFVRATHWLIAHDEFGGAVNIAAPNPLPNEEFMRTLREAWGKRVGLPATRWMLEIGAVFMRTETELILKSRRVVPGRLLQSGFGFNYPAWDAAARDLCQRWLATRQRQS